MTDSLGRTLPGLLACILVAAAARWVATALGLGIETAIALGFGLLIGFVPTAHRVALPGAKLAARLALRAGVALLGARLTLDRVLDGGAQALLSAAVIVLIGLGLGLWAARRLAIGERLGILIAAGMGICGNSAILALSPIIKADDRETTYAVSTITMFGLLGVLILPVIGHLLGMSDLQFGTWSGLAVNDTAQVVATGYAYSVPAGDAATIVKLTRNLAIAPVVIGAALLMRDSASSAASTRLAVVRAVPWFVVAFVLLAAARSLGWLDASLPTGSSLADTLSSLASILILVALAGVGLVADLRATLRVGPRPFLLGVGLWLTIAAVGFVLATTLTPTA